jgi:hypothetical protein
VLSYYPNFNIVSLNVSSFILPDKNKSISS